MNVRVDFEPRYIRHIAVQCTGCGKWFNGRDISVDNKLMVVWDIYKTQFVCPCCGKVFGADAHNDFASLNVEEVEYPEVFEGCSRKVERWE